MRACGLRWPRGAHHAGAAIGQADARVGDARDAVHQVVKAGKGERLARRALGETGARHRDGAMDVAATGPATRAMSVKACISMFRQMMWASGSGMHRTLRGCDGLAVACACLSVDEKHAAGRVRRPVRSASCAHE
ncbi:hypothetical protein Bcenmc03_2596 [Burkholderia orbicola MC0-3]|uniref:Uncharacterized protein n=1 Tax=Burkholderia orbicola (strain MC0-3) TaxID=406425 RepID=B1JXI2_BURO0|nr:hypothetical protein Bcenmc03_2596 [Burkholderia orbicola MC0-3]